MNKNKVSEPKLISSFKNRDIDKFRQLIKNGESVYCKDGNGEYLFDMTLGTFYNKDLRFFEEVVNAGAHLSTKTHITHIIPRAMSSNASPECIEKLLDRKIKTDEFYESKYLDQNGHANYYIHKPLMFDVLEMGYKKYIKYFLQHNPDLKICNEEGRPILNALLHHYQQPYNYSKNTLADILDNLIKHGADPTQKCNAGLNPLHILSTSDRQPLSSDKQMKDYKKSFDVLISAGTDLNSRNIYGMTPLLVAIKNDNRIAYDILVKKKCNINLSNVDGTTPLMFFARRHRYLGFFNILLESGADPYLTDKYGNNMFHYLFESSTIEKMKIYHQLIKKYPKLFFQKNNYGRSAAGNLIFKQFSKESQIPEGNNTIGI